MATVELNSRVGAHLVADKRKDAQAATSPISTTLWAASQSNATLDAALTTLDAAYWTATRLQNTNRLDKEYALRVGLDAAGI